MQQNRCFCVYIYEGKNMRLTYNKKGILFIETKKIFTFLNRCGIFTLVTGGYINEEEVKKDQRK